MDMKAVGAEPMTFIACLPTYAVPALDIAYNVSVLAIQHFSTVVACSKAEMGFLVSIFWGRN